MTEDTSPENLRKFLESDDPALRMMGISMAKGLGLPEVLLPIILKLYKVDDNKNIRSAAESLVLTYLIMMKKTGAPENLLPTILSLYISDDNKTIRAAAGTVFTKYAPHDVKTRVKHNWQDRYSTFSTMHGKVPEAIHQLLIALKSHDDYSIVVLEHLIKDLVDKNRYVQRSAAKSLGKIADKRAVKPLIEALTKYDTQKRKMFYVSNAPNIVTALGDIGDKRAVKPLNKIYYHSSFAIEPLLRSRAAEALNKLGHEVGDKRAVEPLIKALKDKDEGVRQDAVKGLGKIGDKRAVEPLIKSLKDKDWNVRNSAAEALVKIGDCAVELLIKALGDDEYDVRLSTIKALGDIGDKRAVEPLIKVLEDGGETRDIWINVDRQDAAEALGKIGDKRAVEPLIKALKDKDEGVSYCAEIALEELGHEVE